jgi:two-component system NtrC family response regulator
MIPEQKDACHVLYVEDTPEDQRMLVEAVGLAGVPVAVDHAATADAALESLAGDNEYSVLLLDWNLPAVTGVEFLARARELRPRLPILILTGEPATVDVPAAAQFGAETIVAKPLELAQWEQLANLVSGFCEDVQATAPPATL